MQAFACVAGQCIAAACVHSAFIALGAITLMSPPRDTAGSTTPHHKTQQADAPGRYNQKSTTLRNATAEAGWFYPTPALCKAGADVRGTRAAR